MLVSARSRTTARMFAVIFALVAVGLTGCAKDSANLAGDIADQQPAADTSATTIGSLSEVPKETQSVAATGGPAIVLSTDEKYWPCSVDWFLSKCTIVFKDGTTSEKGVTTADLADAVRADKAGTLTVDDSNWESAGSVKYGDPGRKGAGDWPVYVALAKISVANSSDEYLLAKYNTFYAGNFYPVTGKDFHWGDWEGVMMLFSRPKGTTQTWVPQKMYTARHGKSWEEYSQSSVKKDKTTGHWKVWATENAHGTWAEGAGGWSLYQVGLGHAAGLDVAKDGYAWDTQASKNEIVEYVELAYKDTPVFGGDAGWLWGGANPTSKKVVYRDRWFEFNGNWGQSTKTDDEKIGNSPQSGNLGFAVQGGRPVTQ